jgi:hypothetical protein
MSTPPSKIQVMCSCKALLAVSSEWAGTTVACPECTQPVAVPAAGGANWYVARDKLKAGPYPSAQLKGMAAAGQAPEGPPATRLPASRRGEARREESPSKADAFLRR